jgi:hypothetical protein
MEVALVALATAEAFTDSDELAATEVLEEFDGLVEAVSFAAYFGCYY